MAAEPISSQIFDDYSFIQFQYIEKIHPKFLEYINAAFPRFKVGFSKQAGKSYYMNHCKTCDAHFGDFYLDTRAFSPTSIEEAEAIRLIETDFWIPYEFRSVDEGDDERTFGGFVCELAYGGDLIWEYGDHIVQALD
jgi:hypothetical protein